MLIIISISLESQKNNSNCFCCVWYSSGCCCSSKLSNYIIIILFRNSRSLFFLWLLHLSLSLTHSLFSFLFYHIFLVIIETILNWWGFFFISFSFCCMKVVLVITLHIIFTLKKSHGFVLLVFPIHQNKNIYKHLLKLFPRIRDFLSATCTHYTEKCFIFHVCKESWSINNYVFESKAIIFLFNNP